VDAGGPSRPAQRIRWEVGTRRPPKPLRNYSLWFAKTLADFEINDIAALPPLFCYNS
jgi:hypothetical protein